MTDSVESPHDVLDLLMSEHRQAESMLLQLSHGTAPEDMRDTADVLITDLVRHSIGEESYVYPLMRKYLEDGDAKVEHDLAEHAELERLLKELEGLEPTSARFPQLISELDALLADHIADEETLQFPELRMVVPSSELIDLRQRVELMEKMAPTRPHPDAPDNPLFHMVVGPGVGLVDRVRDALSGRAHG